MRGKDGTLHQGGYFTSPSMQALLLRYCRCAHGEAVPHQGRRAVESPNGKAAEDGSSNSGNQARTPAPQKAAAHTMLLPQRPLESPRNSPFLKPQRNHRWAVDAVHRSSSTSMREQPWPSVVSSHAVNSFLQRHYHNFNAMKARAALSGKRSAFFFYKTHHVCGANTIQDEERPRRDSQESS